ncbi:MAG: hypothetical protein NT062_24410 [Proteobacteria bacterium]|nr:hypothetical protein [Pseudomonadota bacterium]
MMLACGGGAHGDTYARGAHLQAECCEALTGGARDKCLADLPKVDDQQVQTSSANQSTYGCVVAHFACDKATGHATQASAQAQLECIQEL